MLVEHELKTNPPAVSAPKTSGKLSKSSLAMLLGGNAADAASTIYALKRGARETNPLYGEQPSVGKLLAIKGGTTAGAYLLSKLLAKDRPKLANGLAKGLGAALTGVAAHNVMQARE